MSRPVMHAKRWPGVIRPTLAACGLLAMSTPALAEEANSCTPDTTPPVVTCDAEVIGECGYHFVGPENLNYSDACGEAWRTDWPQSFWGGVGTYSTSATVRDAAGNTSSCTTVFRIYDTEPPALELHGPTELTLTVGSTYEEHGAYYHDHCMHGSYPGSPMYGPTSGSVNTNVPGTYVLTYSASDYNGNTETKVRTVKVVAATIGNTTQSHLRHTSTLLNNGRVLVLGGYSRTAEEYNPSTRTFTAVGAPLSAHRGHTATVLQDGKVLVAGGAKPGSNGVEELYNPATGQWSRTGRMSTARYDHTAALMGDGKVLVVGGGTSESSGGVLASAEMYDPSTGQWFTVGSLTTARRNHAMTVRSDGSVLVTGGIGADGAPLASTEIYIFSSRHWWNWVQYGDLATARSGHTATALPDGSVLVVGGQTQDASKSATAERLPPYTYGWSPAGSMNIPRQNHTASLINGKVLVTGGYNNQSGIQSSTELYDPNQGWRSYQNALRVDRYKHTATALDANTLLLVGGYSNQDPNAVSAELFIQP